jgi:hypothetical protein
MAVAIPDVVSFVVLVGDRYPSVNHTGRDAMRGGRKSAEYLALFHAVRSAAQVAMDAVGWTEPAPGYVALGLTRVVMDRRRRDMSNLGKCELDALEPERPRDRGQHEREGRRVFPGLYRNDTFVIPEFNIEFDPNGPDRLIFVARRVFARPHDVHAAPPVRKKAVQTVPIRRSVATTGLPVAATRPTAAPLDGSIPRGYAVCDGELVPLSDVLGKLRAGRRR